MKNGKTFPHTPVLGHSLKVLIVIGLCCYVMLLGVTAFIHEHTEHSHSEDTCTACFYNSQHVGVEIGPLAFISPLLFSTTLPFYETVFLPLKFTTTAWSRAPPVFSSQLQILAFKGPSVFTLHYL